MRTCLVLAHQTLDNPRLADALLDEAQRSPCRFHLVVPVQHHSHGLTWTDTEVHRDAQHKLDAAVGRFTALGLLVDGEVSWSTPVDAISDVLVRDGKRSYDEVIVSTLPHAVSRWLRIDVPTRIEQSTGLPVRHIEAPARALS